MTKKALLEALRGVPPEVALSAINEYLLTEVNFGLVEQACVRNGNDAAEGRLAQSIAQAVFGLTEYIETIR